MTEHFHETFNLILESLLMVRAAKHWWSLAIPIKRGFLEEDEQASNNNRLLIISSSFFFLILETWSTASEQVLFNDKYDTEKAIHLSYQVCTIMNKVLPVCFLKFPQWQSWDSWKAWGWPLALSGSCQQ